MKRKVFLEP